jgi:hypothetical protein
VVKGRGFSHPHGGFESIIINGESVKAAELLTPSEHHQRTQAAAAAAWLAAREACDDEADGQGCWGTAFETRKRILGAIRALPAPSDATAALAEVVRVAKREAFEEAALMLDEKATDLQRQHGIGPDSFCVVTLRAKAAAIRARSEGEGA